MPALCMRKEVALGAGCLAGSGQNGGPVEALKMKLLSFYILFCPKYKKRIRKKTKEQKGGSKNEDKEGKTTRWGTEPEVAASDATPTDH